MKKSKKLMLVIAFSTMGFILGFIILNNGADSFQGLNILVFALIIFGGIIAFFNANKKDQEEKNGLPTDDELSTLIKYKTGPYAYMASMYMWLVIFIAKGMFPNVETMLGGGILLSCLIWTISKYIVKLKFDE